MPSPLSQRRSLPEQPASQKTEAAAGHSQVNLLASLQAAFNSLEDVTPEGKGQPKPARGDPALYTPSDEELHDRVLVELQATGASALKKLKVTVQTQLVTLAGTVPSSVELLMALHIVARVPGVRNVKHRIEIIEPKVVETKWSDLFDQFIGQYRKQLAGVAALMLPLFLGLWVWSREPGPPLAVYQATGSVTLAGQSIGGGVITLHPYRTDFQMLVKPRGTLKKDGTFTLTTFNPNDGAPAGEYLVTVTWNREVVGVDGEVGPGPNVLPLAYSSPETSSLKLKIVADEPNKLPALALAGELRNVVQPGGQEAQRTQQGPVGIGRPQQPLSKPSNNVPLYGE